MSVNFSGNQDGIVPVNSLNAITRVRNPINASHSFGIVPVIELPIDSKYVNVVRCDNSVGSFPTTLLLTDIGLCKFVRYTVKERKNG